MSDAPVDVESPSARAVRLARDLGGTLEDRFLTASRVRLREALQVKRVVLDELSIAGLATTKQVLISRCRIGTLKLTDVVSRGGVMIEDSEIGNLEIRGGRDTTFSLIRMASRRAVLHQCGVLIVDSSTFAELMAISDVQSTLNLARSSAGAIRVSADGPANLSDITMSAITIRDRIDLVEVRADTLELHDLAAPRAELRRVSVDTLSFRDLTIERDFTIHGLSGRTSPPRVDISGVLGSASVSTLRGTESETILRDASLRGDLTLAGNTSCEVGSGSSVGGVLRPPQGEHESQIQIAADASVRAVQAPASVIRTPSSARQAAQQLLGGAGVTELAILRDSLSGRPDEQDMAYFALRGAEQKATNGLLRRTMWLRGQAFGWGVTFLHPLRTLLIGILLTSVIIFILNPGAIDGSGLRLVNALVAALGLWINVGVGMPAGLDGAGWAVGAVACTSLGIALIAVLTGVAIRRLTR